MTTAPTSGQPRADSRRLEDAEKGLSCDAQSLVIDNYSCGSLSFALVNDQLIDSDSQMLRQPICDIRARDMIGIAFHLDNCSRRDARCDSQVLYRESAPLSPIFQLVFQVTLVLHRLPLLRLIGLAGLHCKTFLKDLQCIFLLLAFVCCKSFTCMIS